MTRIASCADCADEFLVLSDKGPVPQRCPEHRRSRVNAVKRRSEWRSPEVRERHKAARREWARSPAGRNSKLRSRYGLTLEAYDAMFAAQGSACALCRTTEPGGYGWCVDHDHETGAVRGILCFSCNVGLGAFKDASEVLLAAISYLEAN